MIKKISNNKKAVIILHEIYGINRFIKDVCSEYHILGFDLYKEVEQLVEKAKFTYDKVFIIGFSVGATIAWRC